MKFSRKGLAAYIRLRGQKVGFLTDKDKETILSLENPNNKMIKEICHRSLPPHKKFRVWLRETPEISFLIGVVGVVLAIVGILVCIL